MDDILSELDEYLPVSYTNANELEYVQFLVKAARDNHQTENWQFSYFAFHLIFMWFIYTLIWKMKQINHDLFQLVIKLHDYEKVIKFLNNAKTPSDFHQFPESIAIRFVKLIIDEEPRIKSLKKTVDFRNELAHCNFLINVESEATLFGRIRTIFDSMEEIMDAFNPYLSVLTSSFVDGSQDSEKREYPDLNDQIREILIHKNYLSQKDLTIIVDICSGKEAFYNEVGNMIQNNYL